MTRVLLLAGTTEARALAKLIAADDRFELTTSLAGVTGRPAPLEGAVRRGGFGGASGLEAWLRDETVQAVVDATHPFAALISQNAVMACGAAEVPLLRLERPAWQPGNEEDWTLVPDLETGLSALPAGARAFIATGRSARRLNPPGRGVRLWLRSIEPVGDLPDGVTHVQARPPFSAAAERDLFRDLGLSHLICKNSGGSAGRTKLDAAAALGVRVLMIPRPPVLPGTRVETPEAAMAWLDARVANGPSPAATQA